MSARAALAVAGALFVAASCGGGGGKAKTTTSTTAPPEETTSSFESTTTSSTIDPVLRELLLVAADLPGFKEATTRTSDLGLFKTCDPAVAPAFKMVNDAPKEVGATFQRGKDDAVEVTSAVYATTPEQATAGVTELLDAKALKCLEQDVQAAVDKVKPTDATATAVLTSAKATVAGVDQTVALSAAVTTKQGAATTTGRLDAVFLRSAGTIVEVDYSGPGPLTTPAERQKLVAVAGRKLAATAAGTTTTSSSVAAGGSSTSSTRSSGSSTTRTTRRVTTTTSTSTKPSTTSTSRKGSSTTASTVV